MLFAAIGSWGVCEPCRSPRDAPTRKHYNAQLDCYSEPGLRPAVVRSCCRSRGLVCAVVLQVHFSRLNMYPNDAGAKQDIPRLLERPAELLGLCLGSCCDDCMCCCCCCGRGLDHQGHGFMWHARTPTPTPARQVLDKYEDIKLGSLQGIDARKVSCQVSSTCRYAITHMISHI